jgi:competence protein ComEA
MTRTRGDRTGASLALLLVLLGVGLAGPRNPATADRCPAPLECAFLEVLGDVSRPGVHAFREDPVTLRELASRAAVDGELDPVLQEGSVLPSGSRVVFHRGGDGVTSLRIGRMDGFQSMTLGIPVPVNRASLEDLTALPGVGPSLARSMVAHRRRTSGFEREEDLLKVHGIGRGLLERLRPHVTVH